jgi:hypothetical protein
MVQASPLTRFGALAFNQEKKKEKDKRIKWHKRNPSLISRGTYLKHPAESSLANVSDVDNVVAGIFQFL